MGPLQGLKSIPQEPQLQRPLTYHEKLEGLKSKIFKDSVMEPGFIESLTAPEGSPINYDNISSVAGGRIRDMFLDPMRRFGAAIHKGMTGKQLTIGDQLALIEGMIDTSVGGLFQHGALKKMKFDPNDLYSFPAFHGSQHNIKGGFKSSKIGTGEGVQAFGHGHYFTDKKEIAEQYSKIGKTRANPDRLQEYTEIGDYHKYIDSLSAEKKQKLENEWVDDGAIILNDGMDDYSVEFFETFPELKGSDFEKIVSGERKKQYKKAIAEHIYETTIHKGKDPTEYHYLDWTDTPSPLIKEKILSKIDEEGVDVGYALDEGWGPRKGSDYYMALSRAIGSDKEASEFLKRAGIDGIRYPTGTLSGGNTDNTFNYVVFDPKEITIEKHYVNGLLL